MKKRGSQISTNAATMMVVGFAAIGAATALPGSGWPFSDKISNPLLVFIGGGLGAWIWGPTGAVVVAGAATGYSTYDDLRRRKNLGLAPFASKLPVT